MRFARDVVKDELAFAYADLTAWIERLGGRIDECVASSTRLIAEVGVLESVRGVGRTTAAALRVLVPELGTPTCGQAAALVGVAPVNRDSGGTAGHRYVQGGPAKARGAL